MSTPTPEPPADGQPDAPTTSPSLGDRWRSRPKVEIIEPVGAAWRRLPRRVRHVVTVAFIVFLYYLPKLTIPILNTPDSDFASVLFYPVSLYVLVAVGLNIVVGEAGLLDLGYVAFFAIGAYTMALLGTNASWPFWLVLPIGIVVAMSFGVLLGTPTLRLRGDYLAIVTLGFGEIIRQTAKNSKVLHESRGISGIPHPPQIRLALFGLHYNGPRFGVLDPKPYYWLALTAIILVVFFVRRLERSRVGRAWIAIREDEDAASLMGVPTFLFKLWAFAIGAGIGGLAGVLYASKVSSITPDTFALILSILFLSAVVLGGSGNMAGAILGGIVVAYLPERFRGFGEHRVFIFGVALVVMMIFRPQGLLPNRRRAAELTEPTSGEAAFNVPGSGEAGFEAGVEEAERGGSG
jgi:branched-chain amino acid transport system permease protein